MAEGGGAGNKPEKTSSIRRKWKSAYKAIKNKSFSSASEKSEHSGSSDSSQAPSKHGKQHGPSPAMLDTSEGGGEIDPVYLLLKQATNLYPKPGTPGRKGSIMLTGASVDSGLGSSGHLGSLTDRTDSDPAFKGEDKESAPRRKKPPKLNVKMKSFSLDCGDSDPLNTSTTDSRHSLQDSLSSNMAKVKLSVSRLSDNSHSFETERSSMSSSPGPSLYVNPPSQTLSNCYAVINERTGRSPEELDVRLGERLVLTDTSDVDWWQGFKVSDPMQTVGVFPSSSVARIQNNERILQVVQNVNLCHGSKVLRLHKYQIVFAQGQANSDGLIMVRTDSNYLASCPIQYLMYMD